jgi:hypothetical protein
MGDWKPLPLTGDPYANVEEIELDGVSASIQDAYVNELGHTVKRPGLQEWVDTTANGGVKGLYWDDVHNVVISTANGLFFKHTDATGTQTLFGGPALSASTIRPTFITDRTYILIAGGDGRIIQMDLTNDNEYLADGQAPTASTHIAYLDGYAIATAGGRDFQFSDPLDITSWASVDTARKSGKPDDLKAIYAGWSELMLVGEESIEVWYNDGTTPFVRRTNGLIESGCSAPYTFTQVGNNWMWLDHKRRFVKLDSRTPTHIGFPYHKLIQTFDTVEDAYSDNIEVGGFPLYVTSFPSGRTTLVYNYQKEGWAQWGYWNSATGFYESFRGSSYCYARAWNLHLVGDRTNGKIYKMSKDYFTDDGDPIRTQRRTGFISHGMYQEKHSSEIVFRFLRGQGNTNVTDPVVMLRWRNHNGSWSNERHLRLGQVGDHYLEARTHKLGSYKFRQYEITHTDACDFVLVDAQEKIE